MNKPWWRGLKAGVIAPLFLWLVLAPILPTRGLEKGETATGEHSFNSLVGVNRRVSVASDGTQGNKGSYHPSISSDGRYVAFVSDADNLVSDDTNNFCDTDYNYIFDDNCPDVFVHDRQTGETERVSVANDGTQANYESYQPSISADGRFVAFSSGASNLVEGDTNGFPDVFVLDRQTGVTERVSVSSEGTQGNNGSEEPSISADGRYVAFVSSAHNLVEGDTNEASDVFVYDQQSGVTGRVSVASDGAQGNRQSWDPSISADGGYVAFASGATNLVNGAYGGIFVHDRRTGAIELVSVASDGSQAYGGFLSSDFDLSHIVSISAEGRYVAFSSLADDLVEGDTTDCGEPKVPSPCFDIFVRDRQTGTTELVSVSSDGMQINIDSFHPSISADGRFVVFAVDDYYEGTFMHDRQNGISERISMASNEPNISADGRYVAFSSWADNLVEGDTNGVTDVFVHWWVAGADIYLPLVIRR